MKILDYIFEEEVSVNTKMSATTKSQMITQLTKITSTTPQTTIKINTATSTTMPTHTQSFNEYSKLIELTDDLKTYVILIAIAITCVIIIKLVKVCFTAYKLHNKTIIKNHNRISPNITQ